MHVLVFQHHLLREIFVLWQCYVDGEGGAGSPGEGDILSIVRTVRSDSSWSREELFSQHHLISQVDTFTPMSWLAHCAHTSPWASRTRLPSQFAWHLHSCPHTRVTFQCFLSVTLLNQLITFNICILVISITKHVCLHIHIRYWLV